MAAPNRLGCCLGNFNHGLDRYAYLQGMAGPTMNHTAQRRHIRKIATYCQRHIVFAGRGPADAVVGRVQIDPTLGWWQIEQVRHIHRAPGVRRVTALELDRARWSSSKAMAHS